MGAGDRLGFEELFNAPLDELRKARDSWDEQVQRLTELQEPAENMAGQARSASWEGENASVTVPHVFAQAGQFEAALLQATSLRNICRDGYHRLKGYQDRLGELIDEAAADGVHVSGSGRVDARLSEVDGETRRIRQQRALEVSQSIESVLQSATDADQSIAQALRDAKGTDPYAFNPVEYANLSQAETAYADAQHFIELAERGSELTDDELRTFSWLAEYYADDPVFAERVTLALGAEGTLRLWADLSSGNWHPNSERWQIMDGLQTNLGNLLGTATRSDSVAMGEWEQDMLGLGEQPINGGPRGYQVMSALMRDGEYETEFLLDYGEALMNFEMEFVAGYGGSDPVLGGSGAPNWRLWHSDTRLNFGDADDFGQDPVVGYMSALSHNPEASTAFFAAPEGFDPSDRESEISRRLAYLSQERTWWTSPDAFVPEAIGIHPIVGEALVAATTGISPEMLDPEAMEEGGFGDYRTADTARVMDQVMHLYGTLDPELLSSQPEMSTALGFMTGMYMDDINYAVSGMGDEKNAEHADIFATSYGDTLESGRYSTIRFLSVIGKDETAYESATLLQHVYMLGKLDEFPPTDSDNFISGSQILMAGGEVRGILDHARAEQVAADYVGDSAAAQAALASSAEWKGAAVGAAVGAGVAFVTAPFTGGLSGFLVPIGADMGGEFLSTFFEGFIDDGSDSDGQAEKKGQLSRQGFFEAGEEDIAELLNLYTSSAESYIDRESISVQRSLVEGSYVNGRASDEAYGYLPH
ncbi:hypothetical protein [Streptomyces harbinensis]|uniref:Uncharacterized protein n=1 Tax=Streptomyces harbinensis TaxID=1176198 RepID=A0A1I6VWR5_9ACTN|nr:hypothetical protein [Streptomyces harbinensis]SFT18148.1 hypothetical protein SAMN05444716_110138 [Streptomyces harbinensis]